ncbi:hypothetical protein MTP99_008995 [Tenebrio molitor]|nr:hypothetical protein MTP99_008995 [Tenebrio molitor]
MADAPTERGADRASPRAIVVTLCSCLFDVRRMSGSSRLCFPSVGLRDRHACRSVSEIDFDLVVFVGNLRRARTILITLRLVAFNMRRVRSADAVRIWAPYDPYKEKHFLRFLLAINNTK